MAQNKKNDGTGTGQVPESKKKQGSSSAKKRHTKQEIADFVGVPLVSPLQASDSHRLIKPLPGYRAVMPAVIQLIRDNNDILELNVDPEEVERKLEISRDLSARNNVLQEVLAGSDGERQRADAFCMKVFFDAMKRVREEGSAHPELLEIATDPLEFLAKNRPGRGGAKPTEPPTK